MSIKPVDGHDVNCVDGTGALSYESMKAEFLGLFILVGRMDDFGFPKARDSIHEADSKISLSTSEISEEIASLVFVLGCVKENIVSRGLMLNASFSAGIG